MELRWLRWPLTLILLAAVLCGLLHYGVNYYHAIYLEQAASDNAGEVASAEAGLTRLAGIFMQTFRFSKAEETLEESLRLFPEGVNALYNQYRLAKVKERLGNSGEAADILQALIDTRASTKDERIPSNDVLTVRLKNLVAANAPQKSKDSQ